MIKTLNKLDMEGNFLNLIRDTYNKPQLTSCFLWMFAPTTCIQHCTSNSSQSNLATKEIKAIQMRKEEVKLFLFANAIILYTENPREPTKN